MIPRPRFLLVLAGMMLSAVCLVASDVLERGTSRADVVAKFGAPLSTIQVGSQEILTFHQGRVVIENGVVKSFAPGPAEDDTVAPAAEATPSPIASGGDNPVIPHSLKDGWFSDLDEAKAQAAAQNKLILFLLTGDLRQCPWGDQFNQVIQKSSYFMPMMSSEYVMLRIDLRELEDGRDGATPQAVTEIKNLRKAIFATDFIPGLTLLSADAQNYVAVDMSGAEAAKSDLLNYTIRAITAAKALPLQPVPTAPVAPDRTPRLLFMGVVALVIIFVVKKLSV